ncbi:MAG: hypothetical protein AAFX04_09140 [Pseudomonadota bacterium]
MRKILASVAASALLLTQPVSAQDNGDGGDDDDTVENIALLSFLGLTAPDGKATTGDGAGELEGFILSASLLDKLAESLATRVKTKKSNKSVVPLGAEQSLDINDYLLVEAQLESLEPFLSEIHKTSFCAGKSGSKGQPGIAATATPGPKLTAADLVALLRSDTEVKGVNITQSEQMVINAILSKQILSGAHDSNGWRLPSEMVKTEIDSTKGIYKSLLDARQIVSAFYKAGCANDDIAKREKAIADSLSAALTAITKPSDKGAPSLFARALLQENLADDIANLLILRIKVEKAGGTLLTTNNIFTRLGAPAVTMGGGLVVTYRLVDPNEGTILLAGNIVCRTPRRTLHNIARYGAKGKNSGATCSL